MEPLERALLSLDGLSVGDALGEQFFGPAGQVKKRIRARQLPKGPWRYTDDTQMALSIVEVLREHQGIDSDALMQAFVRRYDPERRYGSGASRIVRAVQAGKPWQREAKRLFGGRGSFGNGAAMRVAPVGAYFSDDLVAACEHAQRSAVTTHTHYEGIAGAIAVAAAAALAYRSRGKRVQPNLFLRDVLRHVPFSETRDGIEEAVALGRRTPPHEAARTLGSGQGLSAQDTVPFALWCAAQNLDSFEGAFWSTVAGLGDRDTTCAIACGVVALSAGGEWGVPQEWLDAREPLPPLWQGQASNDVAAGEPESEIEREASTSAEPDSNPQQRTAPANPPAAALDTEGSVESEQPTTANNDSSATEKPLADPIEGGAGEIETKS